MTHKEWNNLKVGEWINCGGYCKIIGWTPAFPTILYKVKPLHGHKFIVHYHHAVTKLTDLDKVKIL